MTSSSSPVRMASDRSYDSLSESAGNSSTPYRDSFDDDAAEDYITQRSRSTFIGRTLHNLGFRRRSPPGEPDLLYLSQRGDDLPAGLLKTNTSQRRRYRRSKAGSTLRRSMLATPAVILMLFGILHLVHAIAGRRAVFWDFNEFEDFLPDWGKAGFAGAGLVRYPTDATRDVLPIPCHSHNDYWRRVPLFDALHWGCTGVEADVWLFDDQLYVGHNTASLTNNRTFQNLYVNPLRELLDSMNPTTQFSNSTGHGVFDEDPDQTLVLLIDFKTAGRELFPFVRKQLEPLREKNYLSYWDGEKFHSRAVTVVGTGNTPFDMVVANKTYRDIFFDAPLAQLWEAPRPPTEALDTAPNTAGMTARGLSQGGASQQGQHGTEIVESLDDFNPGTSYYASVSFASTVGFIWRGHLSPRQMDTIRGQIRGAQRRGLKVRYWDTPAWPVSVRNHVWHVLMKEGADILNVDDLKSAATENWKMRLHGLWQ